MALKDIFNLIKADRYTADGCEEIKKAQKAIAEDGGLPDGTMRHRKDGDYIKQAGKWVPAKRANGGAKKTDKLKPNDIVAQQKQKMESEKYEAARRDAQAPSKKTEVNTPGLRKDVQNAIKNSSPEEIKAYIKELRTPGSRMSRYFDNPDLLANVYEDELKKATESKPEAAPSQSKEEKREAIAKQKFDSIKEGDDVTAYGSKVKIVKKYPGNNSVDVEFKDSKGEKQVSHLSILDIDDDSFNKKGAGSNPAEKKSALKLPDENSSFATDVNRMKKLKKEDYKQYTIQLEKLHSKYPINKWKDLYNKTTADSAPRVLTGDCKVRLAKDARPTNGIYHWKSGDYRKEGDKYVKIGPGRGGAGKSPANKPDKVGDFLRAYERGDFGKYQKNAGQKKAESFFKEKGTKSKKAESKPTEVKLGGNADTYYFEDPENMSDEDKVFKSLNIELDSTFGDHDGDPDNVEEWVNNWKWNIKKEGGIGIKSKKTRKESTPIPADEALKILESNPARLKNLIKRAKKFYSGSTMAGGFDDWGNKALGEDAAPRQLTGDCKVRIKKS